MIQVTFILLSLWASPSQTAEQSLQNSLHIAVKQTKPQQTVFIQHSGPYWTVGPVFRTLSKYMIQHGQTGSMYARYAKNPKKMRANKMRCEIGFWVEGQHQPSRPYKSRMQESQQVAYQFLDTANPNISKQYKIMSEWIRSNDYELLGPITEIHHRTFDRTGVNNLTVEIQMPIRKKQPRKYPNSLVERENKNRQQLPVNVGRSDVRKSHRNIDRKPAAPPSARVRPEQQVVVTPKPKQVQKTTPPVKKQSRRNTRRSDDGRSRYDPSQIPKFVDHVEKDRPKPVNKYRRPQTPPRTTTSQRSTSLPEKTAPPRTTRVPRKSTPPPVGKMITNSMFKSRPRPTGLNNPVQTNGRANSHVDTSNMTITELIEADQFDQVAELIMPSPDAIAPKQEIWFGQIIFRFKAVARGVERMYPGEGGTVLRLVNSLSSRYEIIAKRFEKNPLDQAVVRSGSLHDPSAKSRRELMRMMDSLMGKLAVKRLTADELQEEIFDAIDRLYDIMRDR